MADITIELIDHMGSDLSVVNAARVSFDKASEWEYRNPVDAFGGEDLCIGCSPPCPGCGGLSERDTKLINFLARENHWSPFAHAMASFRVAAPVFVARQLQKHTVGLAWNEVSRRYVDAEPTFYTPETWRKRAENVKQGSSDEEVSGFVTLYEYELGYGPVPYKSPLIEAYAKLTDLAEDVYNGMLKAGVCPEQARMVLPSSLMTEWIWSGSLMAFARVCKLRLDSHAQKETQRVAEGIAEHLTILFPASFDALLKN